MYGLNPLLRDHSLYFHPALSLVQFQSTSVNRNAAQSAGIPKRRAVPLITKLLLYLSSD
jgi:cytochrome c biogenesis factor